MTKKTTVVATIVLTLVVVAFMKNPAQGQANLTGILSWVWPF